MFTLKASIVSRAQRIAWGSRFIIIVVSLRNTIWCTRPGVAHFSSPGNLNSSCHGGCREISNNSYIPSHLVAYIVTLTAKRDIFCKLKHIKCPILQFTQRYIQKCVIKLIQDSLNPRNIIVPRQNSVKAVQCPWHEYENELIPWPWYTRTSI